MKKDLSFKVIPAKDLHTISEYAREVEKEKVFGKIIAFIIDDCVKSAQVGKFSCEFDLENSLVSFSGNVHIEGEELKAKCSSVDMIYLLSEKMRNRLRNSDDSRIVAYNEATPFETTGKKTKIKKWKIKFKHHQASFK